MPKFSKLPVPMPEVSYVQKILGDSKIDFLVDGVSAFVAFGCASMNEWRHNELDADFFGDELTYGVVTLNLCVREAALASLKEAFTAVGLSGRDLSPGHSTFGLRPAPAEINPKSSLPLFFEVQVRAAADYNDLARRSVPFHAEGASFRCLGIPDLMNWTVLEELDVQAELLTEICTALNQQYTYTGSLTLEADSSL